MGIMLLSNENIMWLRTDGVVILRGTECHFWLRRDCTDGTHWA